jgi:1-acyl-sn-glycerol-3-phosphate acyltransferase
MRRILRTGFYILFRLFTRLTVIGRDNIPSEGGCLLVGNHLGIIDGPLIFCLIKRNDTTGLVALKHKKNPAIRFVVENAKGIWINREETDFKALKQARSHLKNGGVLGIAPEGTRTDDHQLIQAKPGVVFLADNSDAVVVPIGITGTENSLKKVLTLQRPKVTIEFGQPFHLPPLDRTDRDSSLQQNTDEIMCQIAAMLPEKYRGYYRDHPRLKELLSN